MRSSVSSPSIPFSHTSSRTRSKLPPLQPVETFLARRDGLDVVAFVAQKRAEGLADAAFIVDDENGCWRSWLLASLDVPRRGSALPAAVAGTSAAGNRITKRVPTGKLSSARIVPLCSAIIRLAIASPNPVPRSFVEKCGRNSRSLSSGEIPWPLSEISISTASPSLSTRVATPIRRSGEPSIASAALSIRFAITCRISSGSAFTGGKRCGEIRRAASHRPGGRGKDRARWPRSHSGPQAPAARQGSARTARIR